MDENLLSFKNLVDGYVADNTYPFWYDGFDAASISEDRKLMAAINDYNTVPCTNKIQFLESLCPVGIELTVKGATTVTTCLHPSYLI